MTQHTTAGKLMGPDCDPAQAAEFVRTWHGDGEDLIAVTQLPAAVTKFASARRWCEVFDADDGVLESATYPSDPGSIPQSVYVTVGRLRERPQRGRGAKAQMLGSPGLALDLDVRDTGFDSWADVWAVVEMCDRVGIPPTLVTSTGSGGGHPWWKTSPILTVGEQEHYGKALRLWIERQTELGLDHVEDATRVMRLPGSVRQRKLSDDPRLEPTLCRIERNLGADATVDLGRIHRLTEKVVADWEEWTAKRRRRNAWAEHRAAEELARMADAREGGWAWAWTIAHAPEAYAEATSWDAILIPAGWKKHGEPDSEQRQEWTRPGGGEKSPRSAVVGWVGSPHVMSLMSLDPSTGLRELHEAGLPLTKARVAAALLHNGNLAQLLTEWLRTSMKDAR